MKYPLAKYPDHVSSNDLDHCSIMILDDTGVIKNWNKGAENIKGYTSEEITGSNFSVLFTEDDRINKIPEKLMNDAIMFGKVCQHGWRVRKNGTVFLAEVVFTALFDDTGKIIGFTEIIHDNTEVRNHIDFEQSNLDALINNINDELWSVDREYRLITANNAFNKLMVSLAGKPISRGESLLDTDYNTDQISRFKEYYDRAFGGESFTVTEIMSLPAGYISEISFSPIYNGGAVGGAACRTCDITYKRREELKQQQIDRRFRALIENTKDGIAILSPDGKPIYISPSAEKILGYTNEELMQTDLFRIMNPDFIAAEREEMERCIANPGIPMEGRAVQMKHKFGAWRWMQGVKTNLLQDEGIKGIVLNFRDITDIYVAEEDLKNSEAKLIQAQELANMGTCDINFSTGIAYWSDEHCRIFGLGPGNNIQSYTLWMSFIHPEDFRQVLMTIDNPMSADKNFALDYRIIRSDQSMRYIHSICHSDTDDSGKKSGLYCVITDVTEIKEAQQKLLYANRLLSFKSEINKTLAEKIDEQSFLSRACELAVNYGKFDMAWINKPDITDKRVNFFATYNLSEFETAFFKNFVHYDETGPTGTVLRTGKPHVVNNFACWSNHGARKIYAVEKGYNSAISVPIKRSGEIIYTLNLFSKQSDIFNREEVSLLEEAANDISLALDFINSESKRIEIEINLQNSENKFRSLIENSSDGVAIFSAKGELTYIAPRVEAILGYTVAEMMQMDLLSITNPDALQARNDFMEKVLANPGIPMKGFTKQMRHKNGKWLWLETTMTNMLENPAIGAIVDNFRDVTERKQAEEEIIHANRLYTFISELNHIIVYSEDEHTLFKEACRIAVELGQFKVAWIGMVYASENKFDIAEHFGMTEEIAARFRNVTYQEDGPVGIAVATGNQCVCDFETQPGLAGWKLFASEQNWRSYIVIPVKQNGKIIATFNLCAAQADYFNEEITSLLNVAADDISFAVGVFDKSRQRQLFERELSHSEQRLKQAQEIAHFGNWELDLRTMLFNWSEEICRIYGIATDDNIHSFEDWLTFIHQDDLERVKMIAEDGIVNLVEKDFFYRIRRKDGGVRHIFTIARFEYAEPGVAKLVYGASHDVTELKESEEKLKHSEKRLKEAQELAHVGNWELDLETFIIRMSEEACKIYGLDLDAGLFQFSQLLNYIHTDDFEFVLKSIDEAKRAPDGFSDFAHRILRNDGSVRCVHVLAHYEMDITGKPVNLVGTLQDITEMWLAEEKLKASEHRFRSLTENNAGGVGIIDAEGKVTYVTPSITKILGYTAEEFSGLDIFSLMHPDDNISAGKSMEKAFQNPGLSFPCTTSRMRHKDGSWRWIDAIVTNMLHDPDVNGIVNNFRDITEKKEADDKLVYANRLYAFISEVNHAIIHCNSEQALFMEVCRIANEIGKFRMAWVGLADELTDLVVPVACAGEGCSYIKNLEVSADKNVPEGNGPIGIAIRENRIVYSNDISSDANMAPWRENALSHGFNSTVALPLNKGGYVLGVVTLYSGGINVFDKDEISLLKDVANDLSFALDIMENEILRTRLSKKLKQNELLLLRAQEVANFGSFEADFATRSGIWSEQFCNIYGIAPTNNLQNYDSWLSFIHPEDKERVADIIRESNSSGKNVNFHYRIIRRDGSVRHIYSYRQIEFNSQGQPSGAFVVAHDITDEIAQIARLEFQDKQLTEIAWLQSHIVRAPLANILGLCQMVDYELLNKETSDIFKFIFESSEKLDQVICEIVEKARTQNG